MKPEEIASIKARVEKEFLDRPGVTGVGVGYKEVGGQRTNEVAIIIYVKEKKPLAALTGAERVPPVIEGVKTDVKARKIELKNRFARLEDLRPKVDATNYGVLHGGISIGPCRSVHIAGDDVACQGVPGPGNYIFVGTLGAFVIDNATNAEMMLSNFHVMALDSNWNAGDTIAQPSLVDAGTCPADVVGALQRAVLGGQVDCAVASHTARPHQCDILDIGDVAGQGAAALGMAVRKRGRTTGLTFGAVSDIALTVTIDYCNGLGSVTLNDQIGIDVDAAQSAQFGDGGDSGSVVVDNARNVVGLYFAGDEPGTFGVANPIAAVLAALNVRLCIPGTLKFLDDPTRKFIDDPTVKFADDPTRKFIDDPTVKFADDPTRKFADDPTLKFADDPTSKFADDPTLKFADDPTIKFADDPTIKFADDPTLKFADDGGTSPSVDQGTNPAIDPFKAPVYDKPPESDFTTSPAGDVPGMPPIGGGMSPGGGAAPFVLATPHHSQAYMTQSGQSAQGPSGQQSSGQSPEVQEMEAGLKELEAGLRELEAARQQRALTPAEQERFSRALAQYRALLAQLQQNSGQC